MVTRQDREPKRMSPLNRKDLAECRTTALYRAWKGQLFIQDQRVCDLALRSPYSGTIPAQLPAKLETRHVVAVSDLRKKLPAVAFGKSNYANDEVHSQGILFSLYEVETLNQNELKVDELIQSLKEKDLALVRYLNERGLFILLTSSALSKEKDCVPEELPRLQALFVISSPRPTCLTAKDLRCNHRANERSPQIHSLLPALCYALAEAAKDLKERRVPPGVLVKQHVQEVATLDKSLLPTFTHPDRPSPSFDQFLKKSDLEAVSGKCSQKSFSRLQRYLSDPQSYTLEMSVASTSSGTDSQSPPSSSASDPGSTLTLRSGPLPREGSAQLVEKPRSGQSAEPTALSGAEGAGRPSRVSERNLQRCKRKSGRFLGVSTRKKWAPLKVLCIMESGKKQKKSKKKKRDLSSPSAKTQRPSPDSGEPTLKLKNLQYPLRRKRGAEVLSAEFVHRTRHESATKATSQSEVRGAEQKRPRLLIGSESMEVEKIDKSQTAKKKCNDRNTDVAESETLGDENSPSSGSPIPQDTPSPLRRDECDSHALNMLADLALSSRNSPLLTNTNRSGFSRSPLRERRHLQREKLLQKASDHEYHRMNAKLKGTYLPSRSPQRSCSAPVRPEQSVDSPSSPRERCRVSSWKKKSAKTQPAPPHAALSTESGDLSDSSMSSLISTEHSYASLAPEPLQKQLPWRGPPNPPSSKNGVKNAKLGPLVEKVLPFRHQQNICHPHKHFRTYLPFLRSVIMAARPKEDFGKSHQVTFCNQSVRVTCRWEAEYHFSLDSKYTNNLLEKTVVRAIHGPWDPSLSDDLEEMKLILHVWVALFYSKPFRSPTARKVVEHSNPAKYVSLNSVVDPLELIDDGEGFCDSEKHAVDSFSEACRMPDKAEARDCFLVEKPLSCNELSSTNCVENEAALADSVETGNPPLNDEPVSSFTSDSAGLPQVFNKVPKEKAEEEVISLLSQSRGSVNGQGGGCSTPDTEAEAVDSMEVSQSNSTSTLSELADSTKDAQGVTGTGSAISTEELETNDASSSAKEDNCQISGIVSLHTSSTTWLEANAEYRKDKPLGRGEGDLQDFPVDEDEEDVDGESAELESIDLALSDSNDTDAERRDVDLDQDNEELSQEDCVSDETCAYNAASSDDSSITLMPSPTASLLHLSPPKTVTESPGNRENLGGLVPKSAFLNQMDSEEGFCVSQDSKRDNLTDLRLPRTVPFRQDIPAEGTEFATIERAVESPKLPASPNQTDPVEPPGIGQEDKETCIADSVSLHATELNQINNDLVTQGDSLGGQEHSLVLGKSLTFSNPVPLEGVSEGAKEPGQAISAWQENNPAHPSKPDEISELLGNQEDSATSTKDPVSPNQIIVIEDESQDEVPLVELACDLGQPQNSVPTGEESVSDSLVSAPDLASSKLLGHVGNLCISQGKKGILDSAPLQNHPAPQTTSDEATTLPRNQKDSALSAPSPVFPEPASSDEGSCSAREEEDMNASDMDPLEASHQVIHAEPKTRRSSESLKDAVEDEEILSSGPDGSEFGTNKKGTEPHDKNENSGNLSAAEEIACDYRFTPAVAVVSEEITSFLYELIDTVSVLKTESEGACSEEESGSNWISSMTLECVTPPESDAESQTMDQLNPSDPELATDEHVEEESIFVDQDTESQEDEHCRSTAYECLSSPQAPGVEREPSEENEAASVATDILTSRTDILTSHTDILTSRTDILTSRTDRVNAGSPSRHIKFQLAETVVSSKGNDSALPTYGEVGLEPASREAPILGKEGSQFEEGNVENLDCVPEGCPVEYPAEELDCRLHGGTREGQKRGDAKNATSVQLACEQAELPTKAFSPSTNTEAESLSADDDDQELFADPYCRNPPASTSYARAIDSRGVTEATSIGDSSPEEEISRPDDWVYFGKQTRVLDVRPEAECFDRPFPSRRDDRSAPPSLKADGEQGPAKGYINFSVTKKHKDKTRTFHSSRIGDGFVSESGLINSLSRTWKVINDPVRSMLDMECLRFHYKLKHILEKKRPQLSTSSDLFAKEFAAQALAEMLPLRKVPEGPVPSLPPRCRSPLLITIVNPSARQSAVHRYPRIHMPDDPFDPPPLPRDSFSKTSRVRSKGQERSAPFHLNKLTYNNKLKDCRGDISVIMDEFAELSRVMKLDDRPTSGKGPDPKTTSEDVLEKGGQSLPGRTTSYEHLFDDLCNTLHFRLKTVVKEACKKPYSFYLVETDDDAFFGRIKSLLKKGGHLEADPQLFCKASHPETDRLVVIIRNEDIFLHVHKIPSLLRLKHFRNVTFVGVDSPEDVLDHTYQELFHSGGFVVSDDQVLETMSAGELKDLVKTLEQLNGHRKWRWLLHHKETKKLRENARMDPAAHSKDLILRSCQGAHFTEVLHYHRCDSRSAPRSEYLNCLLNLQVQHVSARMAVFLTVNPSASREAFESKGILVLDVNTFVATAQDLVGSCRSSYW